MPEPEIKILLKRLGESINEILSSSPEIHDRIREIKDAGYEVFLTVETKIGYYSENEKNCKTIVDENEKQECPNFTKYDAKFLKTLKIAIN
jgi:hypothetical protein